MEKILLFNVDIFRTNLLKNLLLPLSVQVITVSKEEQANKILDLFSGKKNKKDCNYFTETMMVIGFQDDDLVDQVLKALRDNRISIQYKAVMTMFNKNWSATKLFEELKREKESLING